MKRACRTDSTEDCGNQPNALAPADKRSKLNDGAATDKPVNSTPAEELPQSSVAEQKPLHFATKESVQENAATATNEASNNEATTSSHVAKTDEPQDLKTSIKMEIKSEPEEHSVVPSTIAMKTEPIDEASSSSITATTLAVKTEPTDEEASTSTGAADASLLLPAPVAAVAPPPPPPTRVSCNYGIRCFRRNAQHRNQMAHPGDADYRRPGFPPAPPGAPACPYAGACYRRNPLHFVHFSHPADSTVAAGVAPAMGPRRRRRPILPADQLADLLSDEDEGDFEDSEDEYQYFSESASDDGFDEDEDIHTDEDDN